MDTQLNAQLSPQVYLTENTLLFWKQLAETNPGELASVIDAQLAANRCTVLNDWARGWRDGINAVVQAVLKKAESFAEAHRHNDLGGLSFGSGSRAEAKLEYHDGLIELAEELRGMNALKQSLTATGYTALQDALEDNLEIVHPGKHAELPESDAEKLARAIANAATRVGITNVAEHSYSGPQLLMLLDDMVEAIEKVTSTRPPQPAPAAQRGALDAFENKERGILHAHIAAAVVESGYSGDPDTKGTLIVRALDLSECKVGDYLYAASTRPALNDAPDNCKIQDTNQQAWDAELGRTAMQFVDRAGDVHPGIDDAETICAEFYKAMMAVIERMPHVQRMSKP